MIQTAISDLVLSRLSDDDLVLDVGGARYPWYHADYVIDRRTMAEQVGPVAFAGRASQQPRFSEKTWISRDFYDLPWPFADKQFDFTLCMGTLEDLRDPFPIAREIMRISKAGYISTPTRAAESTIGSSCASPQSELYGYFHHRWFVEIERNRLVFIMKHPLLYQHREHLIDEYHQHTLNFFWNGQFECIERNVANSEKAIHDAASFKRRHQQWWTSAASDPTDRSSMYNHWPHTWGQRPPFLELPDVIAGPVQAF